MRLFKKPKITLPIFRGIVSVRKGDRNITAKEKEDVKKSKRYRCAKCGRKFSSKSLQVDHRKAVGLYKPANPWANLPRLEPTTNSERPKKQAYDRKSNYQPLCKRCHPKKTKDDVKKIKTKRRKELSWLGTSQNYGFGFR